MKYLFNCFNSFIAYFKFLLSKRPFVNLGIGTGIGIDITNAIISSSIRPMETKISCLVT